MTAQEAWSHEEVEAVVADYLHMLTLEFSSQTYNKSLHRRALQARLRGRTEASIERKHQNISAVLLELGCPYIPGYKPLRNYQALLLDVVTDRITNDPFFDRLAINAADQPAVVPLISDTAMTIEDAPILSSRVEEERVGYPSLRPGIRRDYLEREARNRSLGLAGEEFIVAYERQRLHSKGKRTLSDRVEHVAKTKGDGLGFDVLSFDADGRERFIEVKTTAFGKETPFFLSNREAGLSSCFAEQFHLYRLFEFRRRPRMFDLPGRIDSWVRLDPVSYLATFR